jgi:hypothetical protein
MVRHFMRLPIERKGKLLRSAHKSTDKLLNRKSLGRKLAYRET